MKHYKTYLKEHYGLSVLETERGFATYKIGGKECYIQDIYVDADHRKSGEAAGMADQIAEIARGVGCTHLIGSACPSAEKAADSIKVLLAYGMKPFKCDSELVYFCKEIV